MQVVERAARHHRHTRGHQPDGQHQCQRKNPEQPRSKRHCSSPSSQTSARPQLCPGSGACQSLTRELSANTCGSHTSGTTRYPFNRNCSRSKTSFELARPGNEPGSATPDATSEACKFTKESAGCGEGIVHLTSRASISAFAGALE